MADERVRERVSMNVYTGLAQICRDEIEHSPPNVVLSVL